MIHWQKSSFSGGAEGNECVELAHGHDELLLRESDDPDRVLTLTSNSLDTLLRQLQRA